VQNLIERCLQLYMNQKEVIDTLSFQAKIEPSFTQLEKGKKKKRKRRRIPRTVLARGRFFSHARRKIEATFTVLGIKLEYVLVSTSIPTYGMLVRTDVLARKKKRDKRKGWWRNRGGRRKKRK
ncbi:hypothetical protein GW17_00001955, partial [Ensete ventricosum]